jgi:DNA polymerase-3 subunit delta
MNHTEFFKSIKSGDIAPVYFFTGTEQYVMSSALKQLEDIVVPEDMRDVNLTRLDSGADGASICEACETFPFFTEKRMVVVENSIFTLSTGKADGEELLLEYLKNPLESTVLVITSPQPDKRRKLFKALSEHTVVDFASLSDSELQKWIEKILRSLGLDIERDALLFLIEYADPRPEALITELNKLASYKMTGTVTKKDVLTIITPSADYNIFKMTDALLNRDTKNALLLLSGMLCQREDPLLILGAISKQYRQLLRFKTLLNEKTSRSEIISLMGIRDFVYKKYEGICAKTSESKLKKALDLCFITDEGLKTGLKFDEAALHSLLIQLSSI